MADKITDPEVLARHVTLIEQLRSGELRDQVKVIMILGHAGAGKSNLLKLLSGDAVHVGHDIGSGTVDARCVCTSVGDEQYLFIDTPGFGATGYSESRVKNIIRGTLGFATRCFGGIHGILYVHSIITEREYEGMTQSLGFLRSLKREGRLPCLTFITTNWDIVPPLLRQKFQDKVTNLRTTRWQEFANHGYIEFGFDYDHYPAEMREDRRAEMVTQLIDRFNGIDVIPVQMPFWEWTWGEIGSSIAGGIGIAIFYTGAFVTSPVWLPVAAISQGLQNGDLRIVVTGNGDIRMAYNNPSRFA